MATAVVRALSSAERNRLKQLTRSRTLPHQLVVRATIVRLAAAGLSNIQIAQRIGLKVDTVCKWRGRIACHWMQGLKDLPRPNDRLGLPRCSAPSQGAGLPASGYPQGAVVEVELPGAGH